MATKKTTLFFDLVARSKSKGFKDAEKDANSLTAAVAKFGKLAATAALGAGAAFATHGVKGFLAFDDAMTQSLAIMGEVSGPMRAKMEDAAREVGRTTRFGADEAAEGYFFLASAGLDAEQSVAALPQVSKFAQAGMFDLARATDLATDAQSALGLSVDDPKQNLENLTRVTDVLVKANTLANASVEQFSSSLTQKAGGALRQVGKDLEEGTAALAVYADQGVKAERAGTLLTNVLVGLGDQAVRNKDEFENLGIEVFDGEGEMRNFADISDDLTEVLGGMSDEQQTAALQQLGLNRQTAEGVRLLIGNADQLREYEGELRNAGGTAEEVADKQMQSFQARLDLIGGRVSDVAMSLGETLVNALFDAGEVAGEAVQIFQDLPGPLQAASLVSAGIVAGAPLAIAAFKGIRSWAQRAKAAIVAMGTAGRVATISLGAVGLALGAGAAILGFFAQRNLEAEERVQALTDSLDEQTGAITDNTRETAVQQLEQEGMLQKADELGISLDDLVDAYLGEEEALRRVNAVLSRTAEEKEIVGHTANRTQRAFTDEAEAAQDLQSSLEQGNSEINKAVEAHDRQSRALGGATTKTDEQEQAQQELEAATRQAENAVSNEVDEIEQLITALDEATRSVFAARDAEVRYEQAVDRASEAVDENGKTLDISTEKGRNNRQALDEVAESAMKQAAAMLENGKSHETVQKKVDQARKDFIDLGVEMGLEEKKAKDLADELGLIPGNYEAKPKVENAKREERKVRRINEQLRTAGQSRPKPRVTAYTSQARTGLGGILDMISRIPSRVSTTHTITSIGDYRPPPRPYGRQQGGMATPGRNFLVGEQGPEIVRFGSRARVFDDYDTRQMLSGSARMDPARSGGATAPVAVSLDVAMGADSEVAKLIQNLIRTGVISLNVSGEQVRVS